MNPRGRDTSRLRLSGLTVALLVALFAAGIHPVPGASEPGLVNSLAIQRYYLSPARGDSITFRYVLSDTATVHLFVLEDDSTSVVDTLVAGALKVSATEHKAVWRGTYFNGTPAPEDTFVALLRAETDTETQSVFSPRFFVDGTNPIVFVTLVDPAVIAPGSTDPAQSPDVEITCAVTDPPPTDSVEVDVIIYGPDGEQVESLPERLVAANGTFKTVWNGENATGGGLHTIEVTVRDRASNPASAKAFVDVDIGEPTITFENVENNSTVREVPDSLFGWVWDRSGVKDTVWVEYPGSGTFVPVQGSVVRLDTLFFGIVLADSITMEGKHSFRFMAYDRLGQRRIRGFDITWDNTPPTTPVLEQPPAVSRSPNLLLNGTVEGTLADVMRIYRNGALADTLFPKVAGQWPHLVTLERGPNEIYAVMADETGNVSDPSNTIEVTFDPRGGLHIRQPFRPGDAFQVNLGEPAASATLRIYDLGGHLVRVIEKSEDTRYVSIPWDGLNGDGEKVKKGPLVAVASVTLSEGGNGVFREIFVFEP